MGIATRKSAVRRSYALQFYAVLGSKLHHDYMQSMSCCAFSSWLDLGFRVKESRLVQVQILYCTTRALGF